jgi:biofilm PGA synthesis N-glycosyltransferase PgaC
VGRPFGGQHESQADNLIHQIDGHIGMPKPPTYVLITPARNEAQFIELTIKSVIGQSVRPLKWVIVSDGSTDGTDEIVSKYAANHPWIELVRTPEHSDRHFAAKVYAFNAGYAGLKNVEYDVIGSLDGDVSFDEDHFRFLLERLAGDATLGLVGTPFVDSSNGAYNYRFVGLDHVSGCCQVFRRRCFEDIGGYMPVKAGGVDLLAVTSARMKGWKTRTFMEKICWHHRGIGTAQHSALMASFRTGVKDYCFGGHPLWEFFRTVYQMSRRPFFLGGLFLGTGYIWAMVLREERAIPWEMVAFRRHDQMRRLRLFLNDALSRVSPRLSRRSYAKATAVDGAGNSISTRGSAGRL